MTSESPNPARWLEPGAFGQSLLLRRAFAQPDVPAGTRLGAYVVVEEIARGGMGVVYLAERADGQFAQRVAIKAVHGARSADVHALFLRERQLLADFKHAHVARLLDGGSTEDGLLWCAMELVEGDTLDIYLNRASPSLAKRLQLLRQLCDAVHAAHGRLFVHRDIKPSNVMVDADGNAKLLDFGIAAWTQSVDDLRAYSPAWASPEQLSCGAIGPASDQHQLGRVLKLLLKDVLPAGERGAELQAIAARATVDQVQARYASVAEFSEDLQRWMERRGVHSYSQRWPYFLRTAIRRHPWQSGAFALMSALAIALISYSQWRLMQQRDISRAQAERAQATSDFLLQLFEDSDPSKASVGPDLRAVELIRRGAQQLDEPSVLIASERLQLRQTLSQILLNLGDADTAEKTLAQSRPELDAHTLDKFDAQAAQVRGEMQKALALYQRALASQSDPALSARYARALLDVGNFDEARTVLQALISKQGIHEKIRTTAKLNLAVLEWRKGDTGTAIGLNQELIQERGELFVSAQLNLGQLYTDAAKYAQAETAFDFAARGLDARPDQKRTMQLLNSRANLALRQGQLERCQALYLQLLELADNGVNPGMEAMALNNLGNAYGDLGRNQDALAAFVKAGTQRNGLGDQPGTRSSRINAVMLFSELGIGEAGIALSDALLENVISSKDDFLLAKAYRAAALVRFDSDPSISGEYLDKAWQVLLKQKRESNIPMTLKLRYQLALRWQDAQAQREVCASWRQALLSIDPNQAKADSVCFLTMADLPQAYDDLSTGMLSALTYAKDLSVLKKAVMALESKPAADLNAWHWRALAQAYLRLKQQAKANAAQASLQTIRNAALATLQGDPFFHAALK
jgi:serine/threonine protein kinase/predicted negative regulator of RcsB-dependent stress response